MRELIIRPEAKSIGLSGYGGRKKQTLLTAARHNLREIQKEIGADRRIKPERICLNEILAGPATAAEVEALAQAMRDDVGFKPKRRDFTQAHEIVFTLPSQTKLDTRAFFDFCLAFVVAEFSQSSILNAVVHHDEEAPHLHVLLSPIDGGKYVGSSLITKSSWSDLVDKFALAAPKAYGVTVEKALAGPMRKQVTKAVQDGLKSLIGKHISDELMVVILKAAARNPAQFKAAMGITAGPINDGGAEFRRIALSAGKGPVQERTHKPYGFGSCESGNSHNPYGFENSADGGENTETIPCVVSVKTRTVSSHQQSDHGAYKRLTIGARGLFTTLPGLSSTTQAASPTSGADLSHIVTRNKSAVPAELICNLSPTTRVTDADFDAGAWDVDLGEFVTLPTGAQPARHRTTTPVNSAGPAELIQPADTHVERDDIYQPDFEDCEVPIWQD